MSEESVKSDQSAKSDNESSIKARLEIDYEDRSGIEPWGGRLWLNYRNVVLYYGQVLGTAVLLSVPTNLFILALSYLPWSKGIENYERYFEPATIIAVLSVAMVTFGPIYISLYSLLIVGKRILNKKYLLMTGAHVIFWPTFYSLLTAYGVYVWFYYLDFAYFIFCFLPVSMHAAYTMTGEWKFTIKYAACELFVIVSALGYTFFLFPVFMGLSDVWKTVWRLTLHWVWFEFTMVLPQRVLTKTEPFADDPYKKCLPALHSLFHNSTIGRMLLLSVDNVYISIILIILTNVQEVIMRMTVLKRDHFFIRLLCKDVKEDRDVHACIVNVEMLFELVGIFTSPVMMYCFHPLGYLFIFNGGLSFLLYNALFQLLAELLTDTFCSMFEIHAHSIDLPLHWNRMLQPSFFGFCVYGLCTMGVLGMIYTTLLLPRAAFCTEHRIVSCSYAPQIK